VAHAGREGIRMSVQDDLPKDFQALRTLIAQRAAELPKRLTQVAGYALEHPDEIAFGTVASIAANAEVQPSALVRFSRALGYQGFSDMQEVFRSRLRDRMPDYGERLARIHDRGSSTSRSGLVLDGFLEAAGQSVSRFRESVDHEAVERAVEVLASAGTIYLIGLRRSFPIASYLAYAMGKLEIRTVLVDGLAGMAAEQARFITAGDAVLPISFTPYASETVALTAAAKAAGAKIVAITDSVFSPLAAVADVRLEVSEADFEGFRSMAATMALAMTLAVAVAGTREER
jgi:DNA-binding MurR/RpiR family transcriptional regulator